jgi:serine/threonine-protein kinase
VGRFWIGDLIGRGGMATVHVGKMDGGLGFSRTVAIKRLQGHLATDPAFVRMLLDEARLVGHVQHPHVAEVIDVVQTDGEVLVVMEHIVGQSLAKLLERNTDSALPVPVAVATAIMAGALRGLHAAHVATDDQGRSLGIVHRDVSPQNVMVGVDGLARIIDFGVAKAVHRLQTTNDGDVKGKVAYMSPEQIENEPLDARSDVFAAAVVLWEMLAQRRLFKAENFGATALAIIRGKIPPLSDYRDDVPDALHDTILRGLARDRADRFDSAKDMAIALDESVTPASADQVGEWVRSLWDGGDARAACVTRLEHELSAPLSGPAPGLLVSPDAVARFSAAATVIGAPASARTGTPSSNQGRLVGAGVVLTIALSASIVLLGRERKAPVTPTELSAPSTTPPLDVPPVALATAAPSAVSVPSPDPSAASTAPTAVPAAHVSHPPTRHASGASTKSRKPSCDPPWVINENGVRRFKEECIGR